MLLGLVGSAYVVFIVSTARPQLESCGWQFAHDPLASFE